MTGPWGVLATTLAIQALVSMAVLAVPAMAPALGEALRASPGLIGVYIAILYVGAMVASMASGPLVVRRGAIRVSQLGLLAGALVPPLVVMGGVAAALWSVAAGCIACVLLAQVTRGPLDADREHGHAIDLARLVAPVLLVARQPTLARLAACSLVFSALQMSLAAYLVTYLHTELGHSLIAAGAALSVAQVGGVIGRVVWGHIADRWLGARRMLALVAGLMALSAIATACLAPAVPQALVLALLVAFGASATGWNGVYLAEVARLAPPGMASAATGGSLAITFFGVVLGPMVFGGIASAFGSYRAGYLLLAIPAACCAWLLARAAQPGAQR